MNRTKVLDSLNTARVRFQSKNGVHYETIPEMVASIAHHLERDFIQEVARKPVVSWMYDSNAITLEFPKTKESCYVYEKSIKDNLVVEMDGIQKNILECTKNSDGTYRVTVDHDIEPEHIQILNTALCNIIGLKFVFKQKSDSAMSKALYFI